VASAAHLGQMQQGVSDALARVTALRITQRAALSRNSLARRCSVSIAA